MPSFRKLTRENLYIFAIFLHSEPQYYLHLKLHTMNINSQRRPVTGRACNILNLRIFRSESAKHSGAKKFIQIECIETGGTADLISEIAIRARHSEYEIVFMRALYARLRIYLSTYRSRVQLRPAFRDFWKIQQKLSLADGAEDCSNARWQSR